MLMLKTQEHYSRHARTQAAYLFPTSKYASAQVIFPDVLGASRLLEARVRMQSKVTLWDASKNELEARMN